jgi:hypothetical protein
MADPLGRRLFPVHDVDGSLLPDLGSEGVVIRRSNRGLSRMMCQRIGPVFRRELKVAAQSYANYLGTSPPSHLLDDSNPWTRSVSGQRDRDQKQKFACPPSAQLMGRFPGDAFELRASQTVSDPMIMHFGGNAVRRHDWRECP